MNQYYVYILTNKSKTLYTGITNDLQRRVFEHKQKIIHGFTSKYNIDKLVYFEISQDVNSAITREKQIKGWLRSKKVKLIESMNPAWQDLSNEWFDASTLEDFIKRDSSVVPAKAVIPSE